MESKAIYCAECWATVKAKHFNTKYCRPCREKLLKRPAHSMTEAQINQARALIGKMSREEIASAVGTSVSSLKRAFRGTRLAFYNYCVVNPGLVRQVNSYYEKHGKNKTAEAFGLKPKQVEHIVYRYKLAKPRQIRWTDKQITEAARMAGLISLKAQAKYFNRPNANAGSIKSLWNKRFQTAGGCINGMTRWTAKELVTSKAKYLKPIGNTRKGEPVEFRNLILWVDMEKCLKPGLPKFLQDAIYTMADFQRWLWRSDNPKPLIMKMIKEREL